MIPGHKIWTCKDCGGSLEFVQELPSDDHEVRCTRCGRGGVIEVLILDKPIKNSADYLL